MSGILSYPSFSTINVDHQDEIKNHTRIFDPFSDFNFVNLFCWNVDDSMSVCELNGNLVIKFSDYVSSQSFLSFIGNRQVDATARELLNFAHNNNLPTRLKLVPEFVARELARSEDFVVEEDRDSHDYIVSTVALAELSGQAHKHTKRQVNSFETVHGSVASFSKINLSDPKTVDDVMEIFLKRESFRGGNDDARELIAIRRLLRNESELTLTGYGVRVGGKLKAFIIIEYAGEIGSTGHFWKADTSIKGIYHYLIHNLSKELLSLGITEINIEQDLGLQGLRTAKSFLRPTTFLKKYNVMQRTNFRQYIDETVGGYEEIDSRLQVVQSD